MRFITILSLFLFLTCNYSIGQNNLSNTQIDSLMKVNAPFVYENPQESYTIAKIIYEASVKNNYDIGIAMSLRKIALYHSEILKDYNKALSFNDKGYEISKKMNNDTLMLFFNFNKGALYGKLGFLKRGITILDACLLQTDIIKMLRKEA